MKRQIIIRFSNYSLLCYLCKKERYAKRNTGLCRKCYKRLYDWMYNHDHNIINKEVLEYVHEVWKIENNLLPK